MLRRLGLISLVGLFTFVLCVLVIHLYDTNKKEEITNTKDTRLDSYDSARTLSRDVKTLISIRNNSEYSTAKAEFKKTMSEDLWDEYFPTKKYEGGKKYFTLKENSVTGEILGKSNFVFKLDLTMVEGDYKTPLVLLVYIRDDMIYKIESLG